MRTTSAAMSGLVLGRPGRRVFEPSYFLATSLRYQTGDGVGSHYAGDGGEAAAAEDLAFHGEAAALVVGEAAVGAVRRAEQPVFLE
jgi:hypothetical protein